MVNFSPLMTIDWKDCTLWFGLVSIIMNPLVWNIVARNEYHNKTLTHIFKSKYKACYFLAFVIIIAGFFRAYLFNKVLNSQPSIKEIKNIPYIYEIAISLHIISFSLTIPAYWKLGFTGVYLGDYFGILLDEKVEGYPFNAVENPIYVGSTLNHLAESLMHASPAGLFLSLIVQITYSIAVAFFEKPFTNLIYAEGSVWEADGDDKVRRSARIKQSKDQ